MNDTSHIDFDTPVERRGTGSEKWDRYAGRDIIPLWVADMDFRSPLGVIAALHQRVEHGVFGYTSTPAELVATLLSLLEREYGWQVRADWLVWLPGLVCGLNVTCRAVGEPGDTVATFTPVYPPFLTAPKLSGRELLCVALACEGDVWRLDLSALERTITPRTRLLLLCNPHNPVGRVWSRVELLTLAELAEKHDLVICSDEIHAGLVLDQDKRHIPLATLSPEIARRTITLQAPSKTYNIPGLGCSFAVISDDRLRRQFQRAMAGIVPHVNLLGYSAALAAYRDGEQWRRQLLAYLRENRDLLLREIGNLPGLKVWPVEATYLAWIDARGLGLADPAGFFEQAGVGLSDGAPFGAPGFVRLNFGCPRLLLREALRRMRAACSGN